MNKFTEDERKELSKQIKDGDSDNTYYRHVQAVYWKSQGKTLLEIVELSGFGITTVSNLCSKYKKNGLDGLRSHYVGSNYRKLSYKKEAEILGQLSENASIGKYVRGKELLERFTEISGVSYHINAFYRLLHRHGWRKLKPRGQHPKKASAEAIDASKKLT